MREIYPSAKHIHAAGQAGGQRWKAGEEQANFRTSSLSQKEREKGERKSKRAVIRFHLKY